MALQDANVSIDESVTAGNGWVGALSLDIIISYWANLNNCTSSDYIFFPQNTNAYYYSNGINGNEVWYYKIENWEDSWLGRINSSSNYINTIGKNASEVIREIFNKFIK